MNAVMRSFWYGFSPRLIAIGMNAADDEHDANQVAHRHAADEKQRQQDRAPNQ